MKKGVLIAILVLAILAGALAYWTSQQPSKNARQQCANAPDYDSCIAMETRAEKECYGREDVVECLRALGLPIDEPQLTETTGEQVS